MTDDRLIDYVIDQMTGEISRKVIIEVLVEMKKKGEKIPIGFYKDCRFMGLNDIKWEVEWELNEKNKIFTHLK